MDSDFYLDKRWLAGYFEKDWFDLVQPQMPLRPTMFEYSQFDSKYLYSSYHELFADFISSMVAKMNLKPARLLEVGSSLGRTYFEICKRMDSLKEANLIEPSEYLADLFIQIFESSSKTFQVLKGNRDLDLIDFDSSAIQKATEHVKRRLINLPYEAAKSELQPHDLVICSNVIDQCKEPLKLAEFLASQTKTAGILAISCTYQWNDKLIQPEEQTITDIKELFKVGWKFIAVTDIEFKCRRNERHWVTFLSHAAIFQKHC